MDSNALMLCGFFLITFLIIRGWMELSLLLPMSKKERKNYRASLSLLDRWFFLSAPNVIKDKKNKYEKRTIRYKTIATIYRCMIIILVCEMLVLITLGMLCFVSEIFAVLYSWSCWIYIISAMLSFLVLTCVEFYTNIRYHKKRYRKAW